MHRLTTKGLALLGKQQVGLCLPNITRVVAGAGFVEEELLESQTGVSEPIADMEVGLKHLVDGRLCRLPVQLSNLHLASTALVRQIGVYSMDPDEGEILYQLVQYDHPVPLPAHAANSGGVILFDQELDVLFSNGELASVPLTPDFLLTLPTELAATVTHDLATVPVCALYETTYAAGVQSAGEGPAGGGNVTQILARIVCLDSHTVEVYTVRKYAGEPEVHALGGGKFSLVYPDSLTSLILVLR